jgi:hypothetical protein
VGLVGLGCLTRFELDCEGKRFTRGANAHLIDDETVAKMGHPDLWLVLDVGHPSGARMPQPCDEIAMNRAPDVWTIRPLGYCDCFSLV